MLWCLSAAQNPRAACMELWGHNCLCVLQEGGQESEQGCPAGLFDLHSEFLEQIPQFFPIATRGLPVRATCRCVNRCEARILHQVSSRGGCEDLPCCSVFFPIFSYSLLNSRKSRMEKTTTTTKNPTWFLHIRTLPALNPS